MPASDERENYIKSLGIKDKALKFHLENPLLSASELARKLGFTLRQVKEVYREIRLNKKIQNYINSPFYQWRIASRFAAEIIRDLSGEKTYWDKLISHRPVISRTLEIHPTLGTCEYRCVMCLWSNRNLRQAENFQRDYPLRAKEWSKILKTACKMGTRKVLLSGGGEPLLNPEVFMVIESAWRLGAKINLYTNGLNMYRLSNYDWQQLLRLNWIRFSVHSPASETYANIVGLPYERKLLIQVIDNLKELLFRKRKGKLKMKVGIGFVIQLQNYKQIYEMAEFAASLGVDFLDIRRDDANISKRLTLNQWAIVISQLKLIRQRAVNGDYGVTQISIADSLTALINGLELKVPKAEECLSKIYRPVINPFGVMTPCDLRAEPRFLNMNYILGKLAVEPLQLVVKRFQFRKIRSNCKVCMPSGRIGSAICRKIFKDYEDGILPSEQPFL